VAASPELYPSFVELGAVASLLGLLTHDNTDICLAVISLLVELTDIETGEEASLEMGVLVDALVDNQVCCAMLCFFCSTLTYLLHCSNPNCMTFGIFKLTH
jgi:beta-catenin-like protein 1